MFVFINRNDGKAIFTKPTLAKGEYFDSGANIDSFTFDAKIRATSNLSGKIYKNVK